MFILLIKFAAPISAQWCLSVGQWLVPYFFLGNLSAAALGGYALGNMFCNVTGNALVIGFLSNMSTLNSQAYGAREYLKYALYTQRNIMICTLWSVLIGAIWWFVPALFLPLLGVHADVQTYAVQFCKLMVPGMWFSFMFEIQVLAVNLFINYFYMPSIGFDAAAYGLVVSKGVGCLLLFVYICCAHINVPDRHAKVFLCQSSSPFKGWGEIFALGVPGALMLMMDWGSFEVNSAFAGKISDEALAAHSLLVQTVTIAYMIPLGVSEATQIVIGQLMGRGDWRAAKVASEVGVVTCGCLATMVMIVLYFLRQSYFILFITNTVVIEYASNTMLYTLAFEVLDGVCCGLQGVVTGIGKQDVAWKYMLGQPLIGLPFGYFFCFGKLKMGLHGIWLGMIVADVLVDIGLLRLLMLVDWPAEQEIVADRLKEDERDKEGTTTRTTTSDGREEHLLGSTMLRVNS